MKLRYIMNILELGTEVTVYDSNIGEIVWCHMWQGFTERNKNAKHWDMTVISINTSCDDDDIEFVVE